MSGDLRDVMSRIEADHRRRQAWPMWRRYGYHAGWWVKHRLPKLPGEWREAAFCARQRVTRGWDDRSVWGLDHWLARTVGAQLVHMADIAHGWPHPYPGDFDGWVSDLRINGELLRRYATDDHELSLHDISDRTALLNAQSAMRWVADNFGALWD